MTNHQLTKHVHLKFCMLAPFGFVLCFLPTPILSQSYGIKMKKDLAKTQLL